LGVKAAGA